MGRKVIFLQAALLSMDKSPDKRERPRQDYDFTAHGHLVDGQRCRLVGDRVHVGVRRREPRVRSHCHFVLPFIRVHTRFSKRFGAFVPETRVPPSPGLEPAGVACARDSAPGEFYDTYTGILYTKYNISISSLPEEQLLGARIARRGGRGARGATPRALRACRPPPGPCLRAGRPGTWER